MKTSVGIILACLVMSLGAMAQQAKETTPLAKSAATGVPSDRAVEVDPGEVEQLRGDVERLKVILNQMRTNLAFVQSSQSPLKHQFELETDAWQVLVEQMDRRIKRIEEREKQPLKP